jgi:hypothetical protein
VRLSRALVIGGFFLLVILFVGLLFWPFILNEIIKPISLAVWVLLRIFVLSVDQEYYWLAIVFIASIFLCFRFLPPPHPTVQSEESQYSNETMRTLDYWHSLFNLIDQRVQDEEMLKKELARLLLSLYATKQRTLADFRLYDALQQGKIPLPEQVHTFLFPKEPQPVGRSFIANIRRLVQSIRNTPRKWIRRWTGQETTERHRMIDETLCFMETSLEMKNDDGKFTPHQH